MSNDLKRVGLVFTQEGAVDFKKTLQDINIEMNKNYNQFKLTQAQWDNSTKSTEKLRQEQEYLKNAYEIQTDKVNTLKMQLSDLENAENKNTTAIKKKQNELTNAEIKLETYKKKIKEIDSQLKNTGKSIEEFGTKVQNNGKKIEEAGKKMSAFSVATGSAMIAAAKSAIDFEDAFTGVEKTVDGTKEQMEELKQGIRDMAKEIPSSTTEISAVAEAAGQLGIQTDNILSFSKAMIDLGNSTNLTADEAASQLAKFANIMQMSQKDFSKLGSSIVDLGNHFATTEADIVAMAMRLAGAGKQVGLSEGQVLGLATALSSVGIEAEMGGSAISKAMVKMQNAVEQGGTKLNTVLKKTGMSLRSLELMSANDSMGFKELSQSIGMTSTELKQLITAGANLEDFAKVSGMTTEQFKKAWKEDAAGALSAFIKGLGDAESKGESAITMLSEMGLTEVRLRDSLLRAANAGNLFNDAIETGTKAWEDNTALTNEANKRYETLKSKISIVINKVKDLAITFGNKMKPALDSTIKTVEKLTNWVSNLTDEQVELILKIGATVTAIGPLLTMFGKITSIGGSAIKSIGMVTQAIGVMKGTVTTTDVAVNGLAKTFGTIFSSSTIAITGIIAILGGLKIAMEKATEETRNYAKECEKSVQKTLEEEQAIKELNATIDENTEKRLIEINNTQNLWEELRKITDENGKIKEGYETRAKVITGQLAKSLGIEIKTTGNVIDKYKELQKEIDKLILKKKSEAILQGYEEKYNNAIKERTQKTQELIDKQQELQKAKEKELELYKKYNQEDGKMQWGWEVQKNYKDWTSQKQAVQDLEKEISSLQDTVGNYTIDIENYQYGLELYTEGTTESLNKMIEETGKTYQKNGETIKTTFEQQIKEQQLYNKNAKKTYEEAEKEHNESEKKKSSYTVNESQRRIESLTNELISQTSTLGNNSPDIINAWKALATGSYSTYYDIINNMAPELAKQIQEMTGVTADKTPELVEETAKMTQEVLGKIEQNAEFKKIAVDNLKSMLSGMQDNELRELLKEAGIQDVDKVIQGIREGNLGEEQGKDILSKLNDGLNNKNWKNSLYNTARNIVSNLSKILTVKVAASGATTGVNAAISALPGHKDGLDYVPKDDYVARLHKGERVLTKEENKAYTEAEETSKKGNSNIFNTGSEIDYNKMANAMLKALTGCKFTLEEDGIARIVKDELYKVV